MALANSSTTLFTGPSYSIDGAPPVSFLLPGALGPVTQLNQIIFQIGKLPPGQHHLKVTNSPTTPLTLQYLVIENATIPNPAPINGTGVKPLGQPITSPPSNPVSHSNSTPKSKFPIAAVTGAVVSGIIIMTALVIVIIILKRRARKSQAVDPFNIANLTIPLSNTPEYSSTSYPASTVRKIPLSRRIPFASFPIQTTGKILRADRNLEAAAIVPAEGADTMLVQNRLRTAGESRQAPSQVKLPSREERSFVELPPLYTPG
ncbi:hypothetical protein GALMADRAFT_145510 [Galerina marginata CBS 339.88]|uniref:Uncharacterized protein n=1 Tax=Galerina marginata (strain CBS 339.88) TaxID=685588 RepID=A0A067SHL6_GALM3|nr:hypothetical protein GALMADRAFT_145510 [Galerina marginata CBS 339.88]